MIDLNDGFLKYLKTTYIRCLQLVARCCQATKRQLNELTAYWI